MSLAIKTRIVSDVVNIDMAGRLCFLEFALHEQIQRLLDEGRTDFILNLADISYIDSFGLGQLISIWTSIQSRGGQLILLRPTEQIQKLFRTTKLDTVFQIFQDEARASRNTRRIVPLQV
jgi:anti-sigma B factor antagonist